MPQYTLDIATVKKLKSIGSELADWKSGNNPLPLSTVSSLLGELETLLKLLDAPAPSDDKAPAPSPSKKCSCTPDGEWTMKFNPLCPVHGQPSLVNEKEPNDHSPAVRALLAGSVKRGEPLDEQETKGALAYLTRLAYRIRTSDVGPISAFACRSIHDVRDYLAQR